MRRWFYSKGYRWVALGIAMTFAFAIILAEANTKVIDGEIISVNEEIVTVKTTDGNIWDFEGTDFRISQKVKCYFNKHFTKEIKDDRLISIIINERK